MLGFYRRELGKLNWKEESKGAAVTADKAAIAYASPDGPAMLKLGRKDDATSISLVVKDPGAVAKAGIMPKPRPGEGSIWQHQRRGCNDYVQQQTGQCRRRCGVKNPDGPTLDLPPGKYKYSIKLQGKPLQSDEIELGADEVWGLMIGPGGVLALQAY